MAKGNRCCSCLFFKSRKSQRQVRSSNYQPPIQPPAESFRRDEFEGQHPISRSRTQENGPLVVKRQGSLRDRSKVRVRTQYSKNEVVAKDEYPMDPDEQSQFQYQCPICLRYLNRILVSSCCGNGICRFCIGDMARKAQREESFVIRCTFCFNEEFLLRDVEPEVQKSKFYTDTPFKVKKWQMEAHLEEQTGQVQIQTIVVKSPMKRQSSSGKARRKDLPQESQMYQGSLVEPGSYGVEANEERVIQSKGDDEHPGEVEDGGNQVGFFLKMISCTNPSIRQEELKEIPLIKSPTYKTNSYKLDKHRSPFEVINHNQASLSQGPSPFHKRHFLRPDKENQSPMGSLDEGSLNNQLQKLKLHNSKKLNMAGLMKGQKVKIEDWVSASRQLQLKSEQGRRSYL